MTPNHPLGMTCLIVLVGSPGSGKTTWARRHGCGAVHVSQDDLISAITPHGFNHIYRGIYREAEDAVARAALREGHTVIVDRTNRTRAHRERWVRIAREAGCPAVAVVLTTPDDVCRARNARRDDDSRLSENRMARMLAAMEPVQASEGFAGVFRLDSEGEGTSLSEILSTLAFQEKLELDVELIRGRAASRQTDGAR